ncbi:MAG: Atxe2 family lasso peptide isopeptidase [Kordiimonadaceae bacterium]|nr:Atxe2 family lasso peptide isopeptidase [Kordiimonadaceae bacterium]
MKHYAVWFKKPVFQLFTILIACYIIWQVPVAEAGDKRSITAKDLLEIRDIKTMALSPDDNYIAYQVVQADKDKNDYDINWYVATTKANAKPLMVADGGEAHLFTNGIGYKVGELETSKIVWAPDSEWIYYTKMQNGALQIWRSHRNRYGQEQVTHNAADVEGLKFSTDGSKLLFAVGRTRADIKAIFEKQARQGHLLQYPGIYSVEEGPSLPPCSDGRERWVQYTIEKWSCTQTVWVVDAQTGIEHKASLEEAKAYFAKSDLNTSFGKLKDQTRSMETPSPDGSHLAWFENKDSTIYRGYRPPMRVVVSDGSKTERCSTDACRSVLPEKLWWSTDGKEVIFLMRDGPRETLSSLYGWTPGEADVRTIRSSDDVLDNCDIVGDRLICGYETWTSPKKIVSVDLNNCEITTIVDMNPEFQNFNFTKVEKILDEDAYNNKAHAHLVYPKDYTEGRRYPLVIVQYRSDGFLRGGMGDEQPIHVFAQQGFAVLSFDMPRQDDNYAKIDDVIELNKHDYRWRIIDRGPVTAIDRMVKVLGKRGIIDPNRVGISGLSGGAMTTMSALLERDYAAASVAAINGAPPSFRLPPSSLFRKVRDYTFGGTPFSKVGFEMRAKYSFAMNAHRIDTPFLSQVSDSEYYFNRQSHHALEEAGKPVEMIIYPDEYHVKWQPAHRYAVYTRTVDWFNFWLRGVEDNSADKVEQYERWRGLRTVHQANLQTLAAVH